MVFDIPTFYNYLERLNGWCSSREKNLKKMQCCAIVKICCGSGSDFGKVLVPAPVSDLGNI